MNKFCKQFEILRDLQQRMTAVQLHLRPLSLFIMALTLGLTQGCVIAHRPHAIQSPTIQGDDPSLPARIISCDEIHRYTLSESCLPTGSDTDLKLTFGVIEVDDFGHLWNADAFEEIEESVFEASKSGPVRFFLYIHGWKHSAHPNSSNLVDFRDFIVDLSREQGNQEAQVVGIYIGWRGDPLGINQVDAGFASRPASFFQQLSFFNRRNRVQRIASTRMTDVILRMASAARKGDYSRIEEELPDLPRHPIYPSCLYSQTSARSNQPQECSQILLIGHSFGARFLEYALAQALITQYSVGSNLSLAQQLDPIDENIDSVNMLRNDISGLRSAQEKEIKELEEREKKVDSTLQRDDLRLADSSRAHVDTETLPDLRDILDYAKGNIQEVRDCTSDALNFIERDDRSDRESSASHPEESCNPLVGDATTLTEALMSIKDDLSHDRNTTREAFNEFLNSLNTSMDQINLVNPDDVEQIRHSLEVIASDYTVGLFSKTIRIIFGTNVDDFIAVLRNRVLQVTDSNSEEILPISKILDEYDRVKISQAQNARERMRVELFSHLRDAKSNIKDQIKERENAIELLESISSDYTDRLISQASQWLSVHEAATLPPFNLAVLLNPATESSPTTMLMEGVCKSLDERPEVVGESQIGNRPWIVYVTSEQDHAVGRLFGLASNLGDYLHVTSVPTTQRLKNGVVRQRFGCLDELELTVSRTERIPASMIDELITHTVSIEEEPATNSNTKWLDFQSCLKEKNDQSIDQSENCPIPNIGDGFLDATPDCKAEHTCFLAKQGGVRAIEQREAAGNLNASLEGRFWNLRVDQDVMGNHNDIFNYSIGSMLRALLERSESRIDCSRERDNSEATVCEMIGFMDGE